jgi:inosine guanosine and xanthosine phosphorylase family
MKGKPVPRETASVLRKLTKLRPQLAMVLGSGFAHAISGAAIERRLSYSKLPGFPKPGVSGHAGELWLGTWHGVPIVVLHGRAHFYEGHDLETVTFPIRVLAEFGIRDLLLTNAAGGINPRFRPGDFMAFTDHINFMGANPLRGAAAADGKGFVDLTETYDVKLSRLMQQAARHARVTLRRGVYIAVSGPSYETPAEIRAFRRLGADAVGMSTVPEAIVARQCGMRVVALSCITNPAAGLNRTKISHQEVLQTGERVKASAAALLSGFAKLYGKESLRNRAEAVSCEPENLR